MTKVDLPSVGHNPHPVVAHIFCARGTQVLHAQRAVCRNSKVCRFAQEHRASLVIARLIALAERGDPLVIRLDWSCWYQREVIRGSPLPLQIHSLLGHT